MGIDENTLLVCCENRGADGADTYPISAIADVVAAYLDIHPPVQAFPVGSIYITTIDANPVAQLGYGTWERYAEGRVLLSHTSFPSDFDIFGDIGGVTRHTLTEAELPSHKHGIDDHDHGLFDPGHTHTQDAHTHIQNAHTHTQDAHTHTQDVHNHTQDAHTHTQNSHNHTQDTHNHTQNSFAPRIINSGTAGTVGVQGASAASNANASNAATTATNQTTIATNQAATATNQNATATNQAATATNQNATATNQNTTPTNQDATATNQESLTGATVLFASLDETGLIGSSLSHENMPPYITVGIWERTA